jgi:hypothetical protein
MAEAENGGPERALDTVERVEPMTGWGKAGFLYLPTIWALIAGAHLIVFASFLLALVVVLFLHPHLKGFAPSIVFLAGGCVIFGAILIYPIHFFRKMRVRKRETGSIFPSGEELAAIRYRRQHAPAWVRTCVLLFFCLIAFGATHALWSSPHRQILVNWSIPALFWLIAIMVAIDAFMPLPGRQWTGFAASGAFGTMAILTVAAIIHHGDCKISDSVFPVLMAALSIACAIISVREGRCKVRGTKRAVVP